MQFNGTPTTPATTSTRRRNERLRTLLESRGETFDSFAEKLEVDSKTVERWVFTGRRPYPRIAAKAARLLETEATYLWPDLYARRDRTAVPTEELTACYPGRAAVPVDLWANLIGQARTRLTIVGDWALADLVADLPAVLAERAAEGVQVVIVLPDPDALAHPMDIARARAAEALCAPLADHGVQVVRSLIPITTAVLCADDQMLIRPTLDGCPSAFAPVMHLRQLPAGPLSTLYLTSIECVRTASMPLPAAPAPARVAKLAALGAA